MKKFKKILALCLALAMVLCLLAACAKDEKAQDTDEDANTPSDSEQTGDESTESGEDDETGEHEEITEISMYVLDMMSVNPDSAEAVGEAINAITEKEIGVHVNFTYGSVGDYGSLINLAISGGEPVDICTVWLMAPASFSGMFASGQLMDMQPYMEEYGQDLIATVGDYLDAFRVDGGLYGVPCYRNYASSVYLIMRQDLLEEIGMVDFVNNEMDTFTELEQLFQSLKENIPDIWPTRNIWQMSACLSWNSDSLTEYNLYDSLGDSLYLLETNVDTGDGKILSMWDQEDTLFNLRKQAEWYAAGYVWPDSAVTDLAVDEPMKQGLLATYTTPAELDVQSAKKAATGYDVVCKNLGDSAISTSLVTRFGVGMPVTCEEPEAAVKFLNLLYTREDLMNLMNFGIEGTDYQILESGEVDYVDDLSYRLQDFVLGNQFLCHPWVGSGADFRQKSMDALEAAPVSPYLGFVLDTSELNDTVAALSAVTTEYQNSLVYYGYEEARYTEFRDKLEAAGLQSYLDAAQAQLDEWIAANQS